jgi:hypothetical protein
MERTERVARRARSKHPTTWSGAANREVGFMAYVYDASSPARISGGKRRTASTFAATQAISLGERRRVNLVHSLLALLSTAQAEPAWHSCA